MAVSPEGYQRKWHGPLHAVRYSKSCFELLLAESGFRADRWEQGIETDGQTGLYLSLTG